jgi:hypothetical protein
MELLLALLSLLTVASGARVPEAGAHAAAAQVNMLHAPAARAASVALPAPRPATPAEAPRAPAQAAPAIVLKPAVPLYADRLIE